ncbi:MAG: hypothetical protein DCC52_12540 [Chloroflexi bacterium]|nr:MAG: hypothetical protein DCC52_12540 [Chloroflexota bacterium]
MRTVEFRRAFDDENAARVRFELDRNRVIEFVVQLECLFDGEWTPVVRYDTAHGFAYRDLLHPSRAAEKQEIQVKDFNAGLTFALQDLATNWKKYRERYEQWLKE